MKTRYVTVRMTKKQAYAVAFAAEMEIEGRESCNARQGDERLVKAGCKLLFDAWREAAAPGD